MTAALDVQRLVDRLGAHPHLRPLGKLLSEVEADLLKAPPHTQLRLHDGRQLEVVELTALGPATPKLGLLLCRVRCILPTPSRRGLGAVAAQLTTDSRSRRRSPERRTRPGEGRRSVDVPPRTGIGPTVLAVSAGSDHRLPVANDGQLLDSPRQPHRPQSTSNRRPSTPRTAPACRSVLSPTTYTTPHIRRGVATTD